VKILESDLEKIVLHITTEQRQDLEEQFKSLGQGSLKFDFSESQLEKAGVSSEAELKPKLQEVIDKLPKSIEAFSGEIDGMMEGLVLTREYRVSLSHGRGHPLAAP